MLAGEIVSHGEQPCFNLALSLVLWIRIELVAGNDL
jgi:hypothetical protein